MVDLESCLDFVFSAIPHTPGKQVDSGVEQRKLCISLISDNHEHRCFPVLRMESFTHELKDRDKYIRKVMGELQSHTDFGFCTPSPTFRTNKRILDSKNESRAFHYPPTIMTNQRLENGNRYQRLYRDKYIRMVYSFGLVPWTNKRILGLKNEGCASR